MTDAENTDVFAELTHPVVEPFTARVGEPLAPDAPRATRDDIVAAIKSVQDPELMLNVYELGLIYDIAPQENGDVKIVMTLTSPACPIAGEMPYMVAHAVSSVPGVGAVSVELTFDPPWTTDKLSDEIKMVMGI